MSFTGQGTYSVADAGGGAVDISSGITESGILTFSGGTYTIGASFLAGVNLAGSNPLSGVIRLDDATEMVFAPPAGLPATVYVGVNVSDTASADEIVAYGYLDIHGGSTFKTVYTAPETPSGTNTYASFVVGGTPGSSGQISVDGPGSALSASGASNRVSLGLSGGLGTLVVTDSGRAEMLSLLAGAGGGLGQVYVSGAGSEVAVSSATGRYLDPAYSGQSGSAMFGAAGGSGFLGITGGGRFVVENVDGETDLALMRLGIDAASYGYALVTGSGSELAVVQHGPHGDDFNGGAILNVGEGGQGVLLAANDARVSVTGDGARVHIASGQYVDGESASTDDESLVRISGGAQLTIDSQGYGGLKTVDGEQQSDSRGAALVIAGGRGTHGRLVVDGVDSSVVVTGNQHVAGDDATGQIIIGNLGTGTLDVSNGANVTARNIELGRTFSSGGEVMAAGSGTLAISSGGQVHAVTNAANAYLGIQIAETEGTSAVVTVTGDGSELASIGGAARIRIGNAGAGALQIEEGGLVRALLLEAGGGATGSAQISVTGTGSEFLISDEDGSFDANPGQAGLMRLGGAAGSSGSLSVTAGGTVTLTNAADGDRDQPSLIVGGDRGSTGSVEVAGSGSSVNITMTGAANDAFDLGGSLYYGPRLRLGQGGGSGQVTVRDGGRIQLTGEDAELWVGEGADGAASDLSTLSVRSGGKLSVTSLGNESAAFVIIGRNESSRGEIGVSGAGSVLSLTSDNLDNQKADGEIAFGATLTVGRLGNGALTVSDGGRVTIDGHDDAFPGLIIGEGGSASAANAVGTATVTGTDSLIEVLGTNSTGTAETGFGEAGLIAIGLRDGAAGSLVISDGGEVRNASGNSATLIAATSLASASVRVTGAGSLLAAGALLTVGAAVDFTTIGPDGKPDVLVGAGGAGVLEIEAGGTARATATVIGTTGELSGTGTLLSDLELHGTLAAAGEGEVGTLTIDGQLSIDPGADIKIDVDAFSEGSVDHLVVTEGLASALTADMFEFTIDSTAFTGVIDPVLLIGTPANLPKTDLTITTAEGAVLRLFDNPGTGIMLSFSGLNLTGSAQDDTLTGSDAGDRFSGSAGADVLLGLAGSDVVDYSNSETAVYVNLTHGRARGGLAEQDSLHDIENLIATDAADLLIGDAAENRFDGGLSNDSLFGRAGDDTLFGGGGDDSLSGADGADSLFGGTGQDIITSGIGADLLDGGEDQDQLESGAGDDTVLAGAGDDTVFGGIGSDMIEGNGGGDFLYGGLGDDLLAGGSGQDSLYGSGGADALFGGQHGDQLFGGVGADTLSGGIGRDLLSGGAGSDVFRYAALSDSGTEASDRDLIRDFEQGADRIDLAALDANPAISGDQAFGFLGSEAFDGSMSVLRAEIQQETGLTRIEADIDGDQAADFSIEVNELIEFSLGDFDL